eukprot:jgi/Psemu1/204042/e_gw1.338.39.1
MSAFQNDPHFMATFGLGAILFQECLRRCFHTWQQKVERAKCADDSSTGSNETENTCFTGYSADEDYQYEIESFADAKLALAKFEQQLIVEMKPYKNGVSKLPDKLSDDEVKHSYYEF